MQNQSLNNRLKACALMVRKGARVVDIGTDHAYLPIWLVQNNIVKSAIAADINEGPLNIARQNIAKYSLSDKIETRLSNGLEKINKDEVDDIVIAGMGGELISNILSKASWLKDSSKNLILQPMTTSKELRIFLKNENYKIYKEETVTSEKRVYTIINARYTKEQIIVNKLYPYIGKLDVPLSMESKEYIKREINNIKNQVRGLKCQSRIQDACELESICIELQELIK